MVTFWFWLVATIGLLAISVYVAYVVSVKVGKKSFLASYVTLFAIILGSSVGPIWFGTLRQAINARDRHFLASGIHSAQFLENQGQFVCYKVTNGAGDWSYLSFNKETGCLRYSDVLVPESLRAMGM